MHFYRLFGLNFQSEFKFPFLDEEGPLNPDVKIIFGKVPEKLSVIKNNGVLFNSADNEFLFWVPDICKYYVTGGYKIVLKKSEKANNKDIYTFLTGSVFGALFQQRGLIAMHGCTVEKNGRISMFIGRTGAGKSTLALFLYKNGYHVVSDDVAILDFDQKEKIAVRTGPPYIKIWYDTLRKMNIQSNGLATLRDNLHKYIYPIKQKKNLKLNLDNIYVLRNVNKRGIEKRPIKGVDKFNILLKNIYKPQFAKNTAFEKNTFHNLSYLANNVNVQIIERGQDRFYQQEILDLLEKQKPDNE